MSQDKLFIDDPSSDPFWDQILFPVGIQQVFVGSSRLTSNRAPRFHAIVDMERQNVLSVVTSSYQMVTNAEAVAMGRRVFEQILGRAISDELHLYNVVQPATRSFCHIDLTVEGHEFDIGNHDTFVPFLRITNSYNRTRPLSFHLGFCRTICKNGTIFGSLGVTISAYHTNKQIEKLTVRNFDMQRLQRAQAKFTESLLNLSRFAATPAKMLPLVCKVFRVRFEGSVLQTEHGQRRAQDLRTRVALLTSRYFEEIGHNAYAAFNVLTDFASRPVGQSFGAAGRVHAFQTQAMQWIEEFTAAIQERSFSFDQYLGDALEIARLIESATKDPQE